MTTVGTFIPKVFEEHFETVGLLWTRRRAAIRSPDYTLADLVDLDETIGAHFEGLAAGGDDSIAMLEGELTGDDPPRAFAAAFALLLVGTHVPLSRVIDTFSTAKGATLEAVRDALAHGPSTSLHPQLVSLYGDASAEAAAAAAEVLAVRGAVSPKPEQIERFVRAEEPIARAAGWRVVTYCGTALPDAWYETGLRDDDPNVKHASFDAAAWNRSPTFDLYARHLASAVTPASVQPLATFAAVAPPTEYRVIGGIAADAAAGPDRYRVIGSFGHPYFVDLLIEEMENPDPVAAASAGAAFAKMTGWDGQSVLQRQGAADVGPESPETAFVPDKVAAQKHWADLAPRLAHVPRIARGFDVSQGLNREVFDLLDMESRWEYCLRMRLFSGWAGTPLVLERYPQRF